MSAPGPAWWRQALVLVAKDLLLEWRARLRLQATAAFAALMLLLFSFAAGPNGRLLSAMAPGFIWLAVVLCSSLQLGESWRQESEQDALEGLRLLGGLPSAIFVAKALANALALAALAAVVWPLAVVVFGIAAPTPVDLGRLVVTSAAGIAAVCAPGTLLAAMTARARGREMLLPLLLYPLIVPGLLAAVKATACALTGDPMGEWGAWMGLLALFNGMYWPLCTVLFARVIEQG